MKRDLLCLAPSRMLAPDASNEYQTWSMAKMELSTHLLEDQSHRARPGCRLIPGLTPDNVWPIGTKRMMMLSQVQNTSTRTSHLWFQRAKPHPKTPPHSQYKSPSTFVLLGTAFLVERSVENLEHRSQCIQHAHSYSCCTICLKYISIQAAQCLKYPARIALKIKLPLKLGTTASRHSLLF